MGFFQDLKEDLSQAVTELMEDETEKKTVDSKEEDETLESTDMTDRVDAMELSEEKAEQLGTEELTSNDSQMDKTDLALEEEVNRNLENEIADFLKAQESLADTNLVQKDAEVLVDTKDEAEGASLEFITEDQEYLDAIPNINIQEKVEKTMADEFNYEEILDETAVITKGMEIKGNIKSRGSMDIIGTIEGDIDILGKLNITGTIKGNSKAAEVFADAAKIVGEIRTDGSVKIGSSSVIIGNITATSAVIAGAVKGDIDVRGPVILDTSAIVMGNIKSKLVQINNGAVIEGLCSQCYADVNPVNFFDDIK